MMKTNRVVRAMLSVLLCGLLVNLAGCRSAQVFSIEAVFEPQDPEATRHPIGVIEDNWAVVEVTIGGEGPFRMLFDTGAGISLLRPEVAERLVLGEAGAVRLSDIHGKSAQHDLYTIEDLRVGPVRLCGVPTIVSDNLNHFFDDHRLDGVLGYSGIGAFTVDLDYPGGVVRVSDQPLDPDDPDVVPIVRLDGATPMIRLQDLHGQGDSALSGNYGVDSGGEFVVSIPEGEAGGLAQGAMVRDTGSKPGLNGVSDRSRTIPIDAEIGLGRHRIVGLTAVLDNAHRLIGHDLLRCFRVQIDLRSKLMRFSRPKPGNDPVRIPAVYGIGVLDLFRFEDELIVTRIADQSPAMLAGLRPNDRVVEVNGESAVTSEGYRWLTWSWATNEPVQMIIDRKGERIELQMNMEPLFPDNFAKRGPDLKLPGIHVRKLPDGTYEMYQ